MIQSDFRLVILAGGISSRMRKSLPQSPVMNDDLLKQSDQRTKGLIGVGKEGRPFLDYQLYNAFQAGITDVVIVIGEHDNTIRSYYGMKDRDNNFHGLSISYAVQKIPEGRDKPLGTADALYHALIMRSDWRGNYFIVCNSDNLYSIKALKTLVDLNDTGGLIDYDIMGLEFDQSRIAQFGITRKTDDGYLIEILEKPSKELISTIQSHDGITRVSMNIFRLYYDNVFPYIEHCPMSPVRNEKELPIAINNMINVHPHSIRAIPLCEHVPDLTYKDDIARVQSYLQENFGELKWEKVE